MPLDGDLLKEQSENDFYYYEVKPGDSLASIAAHFGYMTPSQLGRANALPLAGCSLPHVFPGQKLVIPTVSKSTLPPSRVRHGPGTALRVHSIPDTVVPAGFQLQNIYTIPDGVRKQQTSVAEEATACQFVKIPVKHVIFQDTTNYELIDGVLIITPDTLCFDAAKVAEAKDQPGAIVVDQDNGKDLPTDRRRSTSLRVSLHLSEIVSMTTMKSLWQVCKKMNKSSGRCASAPVDSAPDQPASPETGGMEPDMGPSSGISEGSNPPGASDDGQRNGGTASPQVCLDHESDEVFEAGDSGVDTSLAPVTSSPLLLPLKQVYLRLGSSVKSDSAVPAEYCFEISSDHIAEVHAFLLQAGVGTTAHADGGETSSKAKPDVQLERQPSRGSTSDGGSHQEAQSNRGSLVEQMLQSVDESSPMPLLYGGESVILTDDMLLDLGYNMPAHLTGCNLSLVYSTELNGFSLATLYRKSSDVSRAVLLVIRDTMGIVFGAIMSERMRCSKLFYGTGETCVFHWSPDFKRYDWTKKNYHLMHGSPNGFHVGGQSGRSAIWFDEALKYGRSEPTDTFNNPVLSGCLADFHSPLGKHPLGETAAAGPGSESPTATAAAAESVPFIIDSLEVWELFS